MTDLSPASQNLLRELARRDKGDGATVRYSGRGRWYLDGPSSGPLFNARTVPPLYKAGLAAGWDEYDDGAMRITEAGRKLAAELDAQDAEKQAAKKARSKPNPDGPTALRLLREIAKHDEPVLIHDDGLRRVWRLGSQDGHSASVDTWVALAKAGRIRIDRVSSVGGHRVSVTDAGRQRLATPTP
ncbi:hypothetical protein ACIHCX_03190 [Streptomyces sp. NPDC052043]|uniref:hypothetical protein n=1 Tax=Streptomyces sp. NPDC052043 TaxID=3365684 RepID=UPI0037CFB579